MQEALHAKLYSEKQLALRLASKRLSAYYQAQDAAEENRLVAFEKTMRKRIELLQRQAKEEDEALFSELSAEFDRLRALLDERITRLRSEREANAAALQEGAAPAFSALQNEPLTGQEARAALRGRIHCVALVAHHAHGNGRACQHHAADGHHSQFPQPALA